MDSQMVLEDSSVKTYSFKEAGKEENYTDMASCCKIITLQIMIKNLKVSVN